MHDFIKKYMAISDRKISGIAGPVINAIGNNTKSKEKKKISFEIFGINKVFLVIRLYLYKYKLSIFFLKKSIKEVERHTLVWRSKI